VLILKEDKVVCFDTLLQVLILNNLQEGKATLSLKPAQGLEDDVERGMDGHARSASQEGAGQVGGVDLGGQCAISYEILPQLG
jgi:hypothetical protein